MTCLLDLISPRSVMAKLESLPSEVIVMMFTYDKISCEDLLSASHTCRRLRASALVPSLWTKKMCRRWPDLESFRGTDFDWIQGYFNLKKAHNFCRDRIMKMSATYYSSQFSLSDCHLNEFLQMSQEFDGLGYRYLSIFLRDICMKEIDIKNSTPDTGIYNLTTQYYATIVLDFLNEYYLKKDWTELCKSSQSMTPEKMSLFFNQWMEPKFGSFEPEFDIKMTSIVENIIASLPSGHPLHQISVEDRSKWSKELLTDNQYDSYHCKQIIELACNVLINREELISSTDPISQTLILRNVFRQRKSNKFFSGIILESVLRRCGVRCDVVYFSNHRLLLWRESWSRKSPSFLVDPFTGQMKPSNRRCPFAAITENASEPEFYFYSPLNLLLNLTICMRDVSEFKKRSFKNAIELLTFLEPNDAVHVFLLGEVYLELKKDTRTIEQNLVPILQTQSISARQRERAENVLYRIRKANHSSHSLHPLLKKIAPKRRTSSIKFAVGMVCYHKMYGYLCVLRGWDHVCSATIEWKANMGVYDLTYGDSQPFYHVLAVDFTDRYVAQENLVCPSPSQRLEYIEEKLAIDFSHFNGYFYIPNTEKDTEYPDDGPVRAVYMSVRRSFD